MSDEQRKRRERAAANTGGQPEKNDGDERKRDARTQNVPGSFSDDIRGAGAATGEPQQTEAPENARLPEPAQDLPRTAIDMAPGIPAGTGDGIDQALRQPDSEIGGGVAGDTTAGLQGTDEDRREKRNVRAEDKERTTL